MAVKAYADGSMHNVLPFRGSVVISTLIHAKGILQVTGNT